MVNKMLSFTAGEMRRLAAFALLFVVSTGIGFVMTSHLNIVNFVSGTGLAYEIWIVVACGLGAVAALSAYEGRFGHWGRMGWVSSVKGGLWVSFVGSLVAGTLILPLYGTMFGPFTLAVTMAANPFLLAAWLLALAAVHMLYIPYREERDSIFNTLEI